MVSATGANKSVVLRKCFKVDTCWLSENKCFFKTKKQSQVNSYTDTEELQSGIN